MNNHNIILLDKVFPIVEEAGNILLKYYRKDFSVDYKRDKFDPVTIADRESDDFLRSEFKKLFPKDDILSEENGAIPPSYSGRVWMIDPLDGTKEFVGNSDSFSIIIGLCINGVPEFGLVYAPTDKRLWFAEKGKGAYYFHNEITKRLSVSKIGVLSDAILVTRNNFNNSRDLDVVSDNLLVKSKIPEGSSGIKLARLAMGEFDIHVNTNYASSKWDVCGPQILLEEAGGKLRTLDDLPIDYTASSSVLTRSYFATNSILHDVAAKEIAKLLPQVKSFPK
jgi:3'(2'), 5'-bisphosphate nucleotidase